ncbi:permease prefix domain 1-containing protein [Piscibacillus halophilus]|uniref:permease prefix domain 1-containing protein n=1 Tax=Piscibacillus halophilus TaxID=571933 RepID=UPI001588359C|nr:permease prefix domain 1-containing protein [Piscibacillus halophilus]
MNLNEQVKKYIDDLFKEVGRSQQLFDLKQELTTNMHERIKDYKNQDMTDEEAFKEAKVSMGDLSGLVEDMREVGRQEAKKEVYDSMTNRISTGGIVIGVMVILFGILMTFSMFFMGIEPVAKSGTSIFIVIGVTVLTYSLLARETKKKYAMNQVRAGLYALAVGLMLFGVFVAITSGLATGELFVAFSAATIFLVFGIGLLVLLMLTEKMDRKK